MKATLTLLLCACAFALTHAQSNVTFAVDMNDVEGFDPASDVLRVAGNFQSWTPMDASGDNILTDEDGNGVYAVTLDVGAVDSLLFKYVINDWGTNEFSDNMDAGDCTADDGNRLEVVSQVGTDLPVYLYNSCEVSSLTVSSARDFAALPGVSVGPNPATDYATVSLPAGGSYDIRVLDATGRIVSEAAQYTQATYELSGLAAGLYAVEVTDASAGQRAVVRVSFQ